MKLLLYKVKSGIRIIKNAGLRFFIYYIAEKLHGNTVYYYNEQRIMQDKGLPTSMQEAATNNEGVTITADDVIFFCDENIIPLTKNWFEIMLEALSQPDVGGVTPLQLSDNKTVFNAGILLGTPGLQSFAFKGAVYTESKRLKSKNHIRDVSALSGDCLLIKKDVFNDIGKFDEINIQEGFSDIEISLILREKGYRCVIAPNAIVLNDNKTPIKKSSKPDKSAIYIMEKWGNI